MIFVLKLTLLEDIRFVIVSSCLALVNFDFEGDYINALGVSFLVAKFNFSAFSGVYVTRALED